ncbi:hypothetical protein [uncultured Cohaesibacter sp.]|uniref:hypothetical protein n=1 Tax=uncultured Cohaesibacter sp. TaxID=1002546 RepID=UPI0029C954FA|nr:hypothetical protein [uncultured Cohaesibacter sp.]
MVTSKKTGTSYQTKHTFLFVPKDYGSNRNSSNDDTNEPGAYFRLGNYSNDVEATLTDSTSQQKFYPRQHISDQSGENTVVEDAAGNNTTYETVTDPTTGATETVNTNTNGYAGIMMACSGRLLVHAGEKAYIHSVGDMHIDTEGELDINTDKKMTVTASEEISITSGANKSITIDAGGSTGDVNINAKKETKKVSGNSFSLIEEDTYKYYHCSVYTYKIGGIVNVTVAGQFHYSFGFTLKMNTDIVIGMTIATTFSIYGFKLDIGYWKIDLVDWKTEIKSGEITTSTMLVKADAVKAETKAVDAEATSVKAEAKSVESSSKAVQTETVAVEAKTGAVEASMKEITSL